MFCTLHRKATIAPQKLDVLFGLEPLPRCFQRLVRLRRNVKPHKVLLTSQLRLFAGRGALSFFLFFNTVVSSLFPSLKGPPEERDLLGHRRHERAFLCFGEAEEAVSFRGDGGATSRGLKLIRFLFFSFFSPSRFLQGNQIRSVTKKSFSGLDALQHL